MPYRFSKDTVESQSVTDHPSSASVQSILVVLPVYNEEIELEFSLRKVRRFLDNGEYRGTRIVVADNGSNDATPVIAQKLAREIPRVQYFRTEVKGRGHALKKVWSEANEDVLVYMDIDLSTDLQHFRSLVLPLMQGTHDLVIGSRLLPDSKVIRGAKREITSRVYNFLVRVVFGLPIADSQCGFKAITRRAACALLTRVENDGWFFDTELLLLAKDDGWRILEEPVSWTEDKGSTVHLISSICEHLAGIYRMKRKLSLSTRPVLLTEQAQKERSAGLSRGNEAFTFIEMMVTLTVIVLLAGLIGATVGGGARKAKSITCAGNLRQLQSAYLMYVGDCNFTLPNNRASQQPNRLWTSEKLSWVGPSNVNLPNDADHLRAGLIFPYVNTLLAYHCPLDRSEIEGGGASARQLRKRSYSMNGSLNGRTNGLQKVIKSITEALHPETMFCFIHESPKTIDDGHFFVNQLEPGGSPSMPARAEGGRTSISFLDGHVDFSSAKANKDLLSLAKP